MLTDRVRRTPAKVAMRSKQDGVWRAMTWAEAGRIARAVAGGLADMGIEKGNTISILSSSRPEWHLADWGAIFAGAVPVGIYTSNSPEQVAYVAGHSESKVVFVEDAEQLRKVVKVRDQLPKVERVVLFSGEPDESDPWILPWNELVRLGAAYDEAHPGELDARARSSTPDDVLTIVYTSGTTGPPKGAVITNANALWMARVVNDILPIALERERIVSYLPLAHIYERLTSDWGSVYCGHEVWFAESLAQLADNFKEIHPTVMIGVPRVYEKFYAAISQAIAAHPKRQLIERAVSTGRAVLERRQSGRPVPLRLRLEHAVFDRLVLRKLRFQAGLDRLHIAVTAAAPINAEIIWFIRSLGVGLTEGYGMTETTAAGSLCAPDGARIGTVGLAFPGMDIRIAADGEILIRGGCVFKGYFKDPDATAAVITEDGFMRTGDVGRFDADGYLMITDRKKDLIITSGGKNIAPQMIEEQLKFSPLISQAVVVGDARPYVAALLTPDAEGVAKWAAEHGMPSSDLTGLTHNESLLDAVAGWVSETNARLSKVEEVKRWKLLDHEFAQEEDELTPTIKVRRATIKQRYADEIEALYQ
ncbi:MAG: AMP-dependent synthetase/ligase [Actinomycetota bacterium]